MFVNFGKFYIYNGYNHGFKKRDATSTTFLQQFYNKSQVVSCYWFKFETNTKITFLP